MFEFETKNEFYYRDVLREAKRDPSRTELFLNHTGFRSLEQLERLASEEEERFKLEEQRNAEKLKAEAEEASRKAAEAESKALQAYRERRELVASQQDLIAVVERVRTELDGLDAAIEATERRIIELMRCSTFMAATVERANELRALYFHLNKLSIDKRLLPRALKSAQEELAAVSKRLKKMPKE